MTASTVPSSPCNPVIATCRCWTAHTVRLAICRDDASSVAISTACPNNLNLAESILTMVSVIPWLNEDCVAIIISFVDRPSLLNLACTSKTGKGAALPALVHTITLHINNRRKIMRFCNSVLRNGLAHHIRRLNIVCDLSVINSSDPFGPALRDALTRLVDVMASAENLAYLRISPGAGALFVEMPAMLDTLLVHPPSRSLELTYITGLDWLDNHRLVGLRNLSLGFHYSPKDVLDLLPVTASSAATLESMHLLVDRTVATLNFTEGCMPYSKLRMLSIAGANFRLAGFCAAFPKVRFIRCDSTDISMNGPTLSGAATNEPQILAELIGLEGDIESAAMLAPFCKLRVVRIRRQIDSLSSFARLTTAISGTSLCSLSLSVALQEPSWQGAIRGLDAEHVFAELCRIAPRLRFLSLRMNIAIRPLGHRTHPGHHAVRQREAMADISSVASPHLAGLADLQCLHIVFAPHTDARTKEFWAGSAALYLSNLPRVRYLVLDFVQDLICLERSEAATMHKGGVADIAELDLDREGVERLLERYQFEGAGWRLDGVADWLRSVRSLD